MAPPSSKQTNLRSLLIVGTGSAAVAIAYGALLEWLRVRGHTRGSAWWAAERPLTPELSQQMLLVACSLVIIWLTDVLFRLYEVITVFQRRTIVGIWSYLGLLNTCGMTLLFLEPVHGELMRRWLMGPRLLGLPALLVVVRSFLLIYHTVDQRLSNERELSAKLYLQSTSDVLTGLANRRVFQERLMELLRDRSGERICVLFVDLDRFKVVNDSLGHEAGDALLKEVAARLQEVLGAAGLVCRNGGDEFLAFLVGEHAHVDAAARLTERLLQELPRPLLLGNEEIVCTASIGLACYPEDGVDVETLVRHADRAMYSSKHKGRNVLTLFRPHMVTSASGSELTLEKDLRRALRRDEFFLEFQPQVDLLTGQVIAVETLVRWNHPTRGCVTPDQFISAAEECDLIRGVDEWVLNHACKEMRHFRAAGLDDLRLAVNLSARNFYRGDLVTWVESTLVKHGIRAADVEVELTETALLHATEETAELLRALKACGLTLALDDFGTGFSSLAHLHRFPVDSLKIDRSLVADVVKQERAASLVGALLAVGRGLSLQVVAEGVETIEQRDALIRLGCVRAQGYLLGRPMSADQLIERMDPQASLRKLA